MPRIPIRGDIPPTPGAPGPEQGGPPRPLSPFRRFTGRAPTSLDALRLLQSGGSQAEAQRLLREGIGLEPLAPQASGATGGERRTALRARARRVRARRAGLITGATQAASGPLVTAPGLLPQIADLFGTRRRQTF